MSRLVDADAITSSNELATKIVSHNLTPYIKVGDLIDFIDRLPTIESVEVVHGKWIKDGDFLICLNCEAEINIKNSLGIENHKNFCPNCGADMRKGGAE